MDALCLPLATAVGASVDQIKLIFCLLVAYPLGSLFIRVPSSKPHLRHLFTLGVTVLFFFPVLKMYSAFFQLLGSILVTYVIAKYDKSSRMPWLVFVAVMGHLTINHIIRAIYQYSYDTVEITAPQMVLTMKLTTFAWNVYDGRRKESELDKWQLSKRVVEFPSLLTFLGYSFYFPGLLVGPYLDFAKYMEVINETTFQHTHVKEILKAGQTVPPGRKRAAYSKLLLGLLFLGSYVVLGPTYNFSAVLKPEFAKKSLLSRILLFQLFGPPERAKYYALWTLSEGASIITGLGFTGIVNGNPQWDGAANIKVWQVEFAPNLKTLIDSWNMKTNVWLRECVYKRVTPKGKKPGNTSSMITFLVSAFWHGMAGGYYMTFLFAGFITTVARLARQNIRPFAQHSSKLVQQMYDIVGIFTTVFIANYTAAPFMILSARDSIRAWRVLGWYGHIVVLCSWSFFYLGGTKCLRDLQKKMGILPASKGSSSGTPSSSRATPIQEKNFILPPEADKIGTTTF